MSQVILYNRDLETMIAGWLHEKHGRTNSDSTRTAYMATLLAFRSWLIYHKLDLDSPDRQKVRLLAQAWLGEGRKKAYAPSSFNLRRNILSSFYEYCLRNEYEPVVKNPIRGIPLKPVQAYRGAHPLSPQAIRDGLAAIDRSTAVGKRDYALLAVSLFTGRRLSEVSDLRYGNVRWEAASKMLDASQVIVEWPRTKGGKSSSDRLPPTVSKALMDWMNARTTTLHDYVWVSLAQNGTFGQPLSTRGVTRIAEKRLGTSKFHALRHSFAVGMEKSGATVSEIQHRLGHADIKTTGIYLQQLRSDENEHADELVELFGIA